MGPTWGSPGSCRPQMGPMLAPMNLAIRVNITPTDCGLMTPYGAVLGFNIGSCNGFPPYRHPHLDILNQEQTSMKFESKYKSFLPWKCFWKSRLQSVGDFLSGQCVKQNKLCMHEWSCFTMIFLLAMRSQNNVIGYDSQLPAVCFTKHGVL